MLYEWSSGANCKDVDTKVFFGFTKAEEQAAKRICADCPVKAICLETAFVNRETQGIWGGTTENERDKIRRQRRKSA